MSVYSMVAASLEDRVKMLQAQLAAVMEQSAKDVELRAKQQTTINEVRERAHTLRVEWERDLVGSLCWWVGSCS